MFCSGLYRGFIKGQALGKWTSCERDLAINLPGCFCLLFLLSFIRKTKNAWLINSTDLLYKNLMKPLAYSNQTCPTIVYNLVLQCSYINGSPQNTNVPGVVELAKKHGTFIGGDDFKSGQTKIKSVLVDFLVSAGLKVCDLKLQ